MDFVFLSAFFEAASLRCMKDNDKVPWAGFEMVRLKSKRGKDACMTHLFLFSLQYAVIFVLQVPTLHLAVLPKRNNFCCVTKGSRKETSAEFNLPYLI